MLTNEEKKVLIANKIRRSHETWNEAQGIIEGKFWYAAANRMYLLAIIWFLHFS